MRRPLAALVALGLAACGPSFRDAERRLPAPVDLRPGTLLTGEGREVPPAELAVRAPRDGYVLVGESHDQACDHRTQAAILRVLADRGPRPAVGLEMVTVDRQDVLDRFGRRGLALAELDRALDWKRSWGTDFSLYAPVFRVAEEEGLPVAALSLPRELVKAYGKDGAAGLSPEERARLPEVVPPPPAEEASLTEEWKAHPGHGGAPGAPAHGDASLERFFRVQALWDSTMASRAAALRAAQGGPVVVLAGGGHVAHGWGIAHRLRRLDPGAELLSILPWRGDEALDPSAADLFYFCPAD